MHGLHLLAPGITLNSVCLAVNECKWIPSQSNEHVFIKSNALSRAQLAKSKPLKSDIHLSEQNILCNTVHSTGGMFVFG